MPKQFPFPPDSTHDFYGFKLPDDPASKKAFVAWANEYYGPASEYEYVLSDLDSAKLHWQKRLAKDFDEVGSGEYQHLVWATRKQVSSYTKQIEKDMVRTACEHLLESELRRKVERVLTAYTWRNPQLGYVQSLNFLAALLISAASEEVAFWAICETAETLVPDYYLNDLTRVLVDCRCLQRCLNLSTHCTRTPLEHRSSLI